MNPHKLTLHSVCFCLILLPTTISAQKQKPPAGGRIGVVVDERLAAVRTTPELTGKLVRRLSRGRLVAIRGSKTDRDGIVFYLVNVTSRTHGWIPREAIVSANYRNDEARLFALITSSTDFVRVVRARIFLTYFLRSPLRPDVLLLLGDTAEEAAARLSREALRRLGEDGVADDARYFLNYVGLDRYNRQGIVFTFDREEKHFHYDGEAWSEILRRYPKSQVALQAKERLATLASQKVMKNSESAP